MTKNMPSVLAKTALSAALALTPLSALAYLSPDQVFGVTDTSVSIDRTDPSTYITPPLQREGDAIVEQRQQDAAASRAAAQESLVPDYADPVDDYVAPPASASSLGLFDESAQYDRRQLRSAAGASPTIIIGADGSVVDGNGNVLHSGAPLVTSTGPESMLALMSIVLAAVTTGAFALFRSTRLKHTLSV